MALDLLKPNFPQFQLACARDPLRPALECIFFKDGFAIATNAHILIKGKLSDYTDREDIFEILEGKYIHRDTWKTIYNKSLIVKDGKLFCMELNMFVEFIEVEKFPNYEAVIPKNNIEPVPAIGLNPFYLNDLCKALGFIFQSGAQLKFNGANKGVIVRDNGCFYESFGLIMPQLMEA